MLRILPSLNWGSLRIWYPNLSQKTDSHHPLSTDSHGFDVCPSAIKNSWNSRRNVHPKIAGSDGDMWYDSV